MAYDWLATGKPLVVTEPVERLAQRPASPLLDRLPLLAAADAGEIGSRLASLDESAETLSELARLYFGDTADGASTRRFEAAVRAALEQP